ncbi:Putative serine protease HhoA [bacterium HR35]|nr:Putative serine protease HhoA [bacterium HR35]
MKKLKIFIICFFLLNLIFISFKVTFAQECNPEKIKIARYLQKGTNIKNIQACLVTLGYLTENQISGIYDKDLVQAVKNFYNDYIGNWSGYAFNYKGISKLKELIPNKKFTATELFNFYKYNVVFIKAYKGNAISNGTGFILNNKGHILTNYHVVDSSSVVKVVLNTYKPTIELDAQIISYDEINDIALLKIDYPLSQIKHIMFANSVNLIPGSKIYLLGYPLGLEGDVSVKEGLFSRKINLDNKEFLEISIEAYPGNSGSPVFDEYGKVIGMAVFKIPESRIGDIKVGEALKFAIPSNTIKSSLDILKLGLRIEDITKRVQICNEINSEISYFWSLIKTISSKIRSVFEKGNSILQLGDISLEYNALLYAYPNLMDELDKTTELVTQLSYDPNLKYINKEKLLSSQLGFLNIINNFKNTLRNMSLRLEYLNNVKLNPFLYSPSLFTEFKYQIKKETEDLLKSYDNIERSLLDISKDYTSLLLQYKCINQ